MRQTVFALAKAHFNAEPEYLWAHFPSYAVLRHADNRKWFAIVMPVTRERLGLDGTGTVDVMNVKCDPLMLGSMLMQPGFLPAFHMNKGGWIGVLLDGSVPPETLLNLLKMSFALTASAAKRAASRTEPKDWLIPANPALFDIDAEFARSDEIRWHQNMRVIPGDTVYIYVTAPVASIRYRCEVLAADLKPEYTHHRAKYEMLLRRVKTYPEGLLPRTMLADHGVTGVRGARSVPETLSELLSRI